MQRRRFIKNTLLGSAALAASSPALIGFKPETIAPTAAPFKLKYAPHDGMFRENGGLDFLDQIRYMADQGFAAMEDNGMSGRDKTQQSQIGELLAKRNMTMGVFVAHKIYWNEPSLASGDKTKRAEFLNDIRNAVEIAKRCNARWMTVVPGFQDLRQNIQFQSAHVVESLRQAAAILEPQGLIMVLEPLNFRDHPGLFLSTSPQAYQICKAVNSPSCKILFDIYHEQISNGNLIPNIESAWDEIAYFQIGDNPGRKEPTTGEINYKNIFKYIHGRGFTGVLGMEHGNSKPGAEGERAVIQAYREVDGF